MLSEYLNKRGFSDEIIEKWRLIDTPSSYKVSIPYYDITSNNLYYRWNYYGQDENIPKYISPRKEDLPDGHSWFYGLWQLKDVDLDNLVIVEGEYNAISVNIAKFYALGVAGQCFKLSKEALGVLPRGIKEITLLYDDYNFAVKHAEEVKENYGDNCIVKIAKYPDKKDANDYLKEDRLDELKDIINNAEIYSPERQEPEEVQAIESNILRIDFSPLYKVAEGDFVTSYIKYASGITDAPEIYHEILALVLISTVLEGKVTFRKEKPNIYAVLVGKSTIMRKTKASRIAMDIIYKLNKGLVIPSDFSPEAFGQRLSENPKGIIFWSEFAQFLTISGRSYMAGIKEMITDLFDCPVENKRILKKGEITISNPYINIITATTKNWLKVDKKDLLSGFLGRFVFINAEFSEKTKRYLIPPDEDNSGEMEIINKLAEISKLCFKMELTKNAEKMLEDFSENLEKEIAVNDDEKGQSSFLGRLAIYIYKFSMIYQISENQQKFIDEDAVLRAIKLIKRAKKDILFLLEDQLGNSEFENAKQRILNIIRRKGQIDRSKLLQLSNISKDYLDSIIDTLKDAELILAESEKGDNSRQKTIYKVK